MNTKNPPVEFWARQAIARNNNRTVLRLVGDSVIDMDDLEARAAARGIGPFQLALAVRRLVVLGDLAIDKD